MAAGDVGEPSNGNPAGFIRGLINEGYSAREGLQIYRSPDVGGAIQDSRWFTLYQQVAATAASRPYELTIDPASIPDQYEQWAFGRGGQYATQVQIQVIDRDTGDWLTKQHTYVSDFPHTAEEAEADAFAMFGDPDTESAYGETVMGALAVSFAQTVPYGTT